VAQNGPDGANVLLRNYSINELLCLGSHVTRGGIKWELKLVFNLIV